MKANFLLLLMIHIGSMCFSQHAIEVNFNKVYIGRNFSLGYSHNLNKFSIHGGITFHANRMPDPHGALFKNSGFANEFHQHIGIQISVDFKVYENSHAEFGIYYANHFNMINHKFNRYYVIGALVPEPQSGEDLVYVYQEADFSPILSSDNVLGIFVRPKISNRFFLTARFGAGFIFWKSFDDSVILYAGKKPNQGNVVSSQFSLGLGYKFGKK